MLKVTENNTVMLSGTVITEPEASHKVLGEGFYEFKVNILRKSGVSDKISIMVSERAVDIKMLKKGACVDIGGSFRSFNKKMEDGSSKLMLYVFVREILFTRETNNIDEIRLDGYICKEPNYRETPLGREITDVMLAVNRGYGKTDYIPCIAWGRNAMYVSGLPVGSHICCKGRIQSRQYIKEECEHTAYEVSLGSIQLQTGQE